VFAALLANHLEDLSMKTAKQHRRYRDKRASVTVAIRCGGRIHDFLKGWGTVGRDGSILWDWWRPPTKWQVKKFSKASFDKWTFPVIKNMPSSNLVDSLVAVQPMDGPV
jgi:hypothetical protein